jgi:hypothetical protein
MVASISVPFLERHHMFLLIIIFFPLSPVSTTHFPFPLQDVIGGLPRFPHGIELFIANA